MSLILSNPQFRLLWTNGAFATMGVLVFFMIHGWLTLTVTDSPFWVGAASGMAGAGLMSFSILGGVLADRFSRRKLIAVSGLAEAAIALLLVVPIFLEEVHLWQVMGIAFLFGVAEAVRLPSFMALTVDVVGRGRLLSANAANFAAWGVAGIFAPLMAGAVVSIWGIGWVYIIMGATNLLGAAIILKLSDSSRLPRAMDSSDEELTPPESPWRSIKEGVRYVFTTPVVRALILMELVGELFGWAHYAMLPVMARDVLGVGASGLGYMLSVSMAGLLCTMLVVSGMGDIREKGRLAVAGYGGFGLFLILFAMSRYFPLSLAMLFAAYAAEAAYEATLHTLVQTAVPDRMRGRVISIQAFSWGVTGVSGFHTGAIANRLGAPMAIALGAIVLVLNALRLARRPSHLEQWRAEEVLGEEG